MKIVLLISLLLLSFTTRIRASSVLSVIPSTSSVSPGGYNVRLTLNDPLQVTCTVTPLEANFDFVFLFDTTGSMGDEITGVLNTATTLLGTLQTTWPTSQFAVVEYKDFFDAVKYRRLNDLDANISTSVTNIGTLFASGGGDTPEAGFDALDTLVTGLRGPAINFRPSSKRIVIMFTDAISHEAPQTQNSIAYVSRATTIANLLGANLLPIISTDQTTFYQAFVTALGTGSVIPLTSNSAQIFTNVFNAIGAAIATINANIVQTKNYVRSVSPSSVTLPIGVTTPQNFLVNLLDNGTSDGLPDPGAYIDFPGYGRCILNIDIPQIDCGCAELVRLAFSKYCPGGIGCTRPCNYIYAIFGIKGNVGPVSIVINSVSDPYFTIFNYSYLEFTGSLLRKDVAVNFTATDSSGHSCTATIRQDLPF